MPTFSSRDDIVLQDERPIRARYVPIIAKPRPRPPLVLPLKPRRQCRVKICRLQPCTLRSHRRNKEFSETAQSISDVSIDDDYQYQCSRFSSDTSESLPPLLLARGGIDGLPDLPVDGLDARMCRKLFHSFFSYHHDRIVRLLLPPTITRIAKLEAARLKRDTLALAISKPIFCLHYIATAHHQMNFQKNYRSYDRETSRLLGKMLALLRAELDNFTQDQAQEIITVILTLVTFEISFGSTTSLLLHRKGIEHLVNTRGGIHNVGRLMPLVFVLDRLISVFVSEPPLYTLPPNQGIRRPRITSPLYGSYFEEQYSLALLGQKIHQYGIDCCQAIEILEDDGLTFDPEDPPFQDSPNIYYFFFLRDCLSNTFVHLNAEMAEDRSVARCMLLAMKIVEYVTLLDNYLVALPMKVADTLQTIFDNPESDIHWKKNRSISNWVLFVLTSMPNVWGGRPTALCNLRLQLELKYGGDDWPVSWRQDALDNVHRFVWSDSKFCSKFVQTCNELQFMSSQTSDWFI